MLLLGHTGITLGVVWLGDCLRQHRIVPTLRSGVESGSEISPSAEGETPTDSTKRPRIRVDYRLVLLGAMVPDIIDKLLGLVFLRSVFSSGRIFSHTLGFALALTALGFLFYAFKGKPWAIILGFGSSNHLIVAGLRLDVPAGGCQRLDPQDTA
ncbi:MAG: metal-dependent hydrolase [Chloroflexota bacterium]